MEKDDPLVVDDVQSPQSSPRSLLGRNQDSTPSQTSSDTKVKMLANSPCTETPKAANPSKLKASAAPVPVHQLASDHHPNFQRGQLPPSYGHSYLTPGYTYARAVQGPHLYQTRYPPSGYDRIISLTPLSSNLNTNTGKPPVHTPISTTPTTNLNTSTTTHGSTLTSSPSVHLLTQKPHLSSPSDELQTMTQKQGLSSASDEPVEMTQTQAQTDFLKSQDREFPPLSPHIQRRRDVVKLPPASRLFSTEELEGYDYEASSRLTSSFHSHTTHSRLRKKKPKKQRGGGKNKGK